MTPTQRHRMTERFVELLDAGRLDLADSIFESAERDPELALLISDVSSGYAEEAGLELRPEDREIAHQLVARARGEGSPQEGASLAAGAGAPHPHPFMTLAVDNTGKRPSEIARFLEASEEFIDDVNDYPEVAGRRVVLTLVDRAVASLNMDRAATMYAFDHNPPRKAMAASRDTALDPTAPTFDEIVARSQMSQTLAASWRSLYEADEAPS